MDQSKLKQRRREPKPLSWENPSPLQKEWQDKVVAWHAIERVPLQQQDPDQIIHNLVAASTGRICSNTSVVNKASKPMNIKMESIAAVRRKMQKDEYVLQLDMSKYYWAMEIHESSRKFFRFYIGDELWQWRVMPFGFINAMQIMKRLMDIVQKKLRTWGIDSTCWVDDMVLLLGLDKEEATKKALRAIQLLQNLGFIVNQQKTMKEVSKTFTFRGFDWRTDDHTISIPTTRLRDIRRQAQRTMDEVTPRQLACLIGKIRYAANADHNVVARIVELEIAKKSMLQKSKDWDKKHPLPPPAQEEREYWRTTRDTRPTPMTIDWTKAETAQGDAGPLGYGYIGQNKEEVGRWTLAQAERSTNHREIAVRAIYNEENMEKMAPYQVFETDSTVHAAVAKRIYTKSEELSRQTAKIVIALEKHGIRQKVVRVTQEQIKRSDELSRLQDDTDITLSKKMFSHLTSKWKVQPTVDLFATQFSTKCPTYFAKNNHDQKAAAHDAFSQVWTQRDLYAFPPPNLVQRTISRMDQGNGFQRYIIVAEDDPRLATTRALTERARSSVRIPEGELKFPFTKKRQSRKRSRFRAFLIPTSRF